MFIFTIVRTIALPFPGPDFHCFDDCGRFLSASSVSCLQKKLGNRKKTENNEKKSGLEVVLLSHDWLFLNPNGTESDIELQQPSFATHPPEQLQSSVLPLPTPPLVGGCGGGGVLMMVVG